jgi:4-hydroxybenzoate polyprenyltransferase
MNQPSKLDKPQNIIKMTRISEWWLISLSFILFALIPNMYRVNYDWKLEYLITLLSTPPLYLMIIIVFSAQIFLFASNNYFDRHVDKLDDIKRARNPVCSGKVTNAEVWLLLISTAALALIFSFLYNLQTFLFTILALFIFYFYTAEPMRFKKRVGLDVLSHATFINVFPYFATMIALWDFDFAAVFLLFILIIRSAIAQLLQEIRDYEVDKKVEKNTVIVLGRKNAIRIVFSLWLLVIISTLILMITYQILGFGLRLFFIIVPFICMIYSPSFYELLTAEEYPKLIETLWMGHGRTSRRIVGYYGISFGVYFVIIFFFLL